MDNNLPLQIRQFNARVRAMQQSNSKILTLNAQEAQSLQAEIYDLLATIASLVKTNESNEVIEVRMDGGSFK